MKHDYRFRDRRVKRVRVRQHPEQDFNEEIAQEFVAPVTPVIDRLAVDEDTPVTGFARIIGIVAVIFAVVSFFYFPIVMGVTSIAFGLYAYLQGSRLAGMTGAVLGLVAFMVGIILL
ncbi:hypothetical protein [Paenibacillus sp. 1001270B_150601_E10]|uniref:hypothetical protein n=1 Tax=Paenibacillus sp. 1001270B_150601_E10 TaxID=2787079 RepID=UPI0018A01554|nr:hypothetical protein [Paenibacillus sp. 1001270B_150601_E10]